MFKNFFTLTRNQERSVWILLILIILIYSLSYFLWMDFYKYLTELAINSANAEIAELRAGVRHGDAPAPLSAEDYIRQEWEKAGAKWEEVYMVVQAESRWNKDAWNCNTNGTLDAGLYQHNSVHKIPLSCLTDIECSTKEAIKLYREQGWTPWVGAKKLGL
jgi:hypothetical protein